MKLLPRIREGVPVLAALLFLAGPARATIEYTVSLSHPEQHIFEVSIRVPKVRDRVMLQMPAWYALYQVRDFSAHVMDLTARDDEGRLLPSWKLDKQTWSITGNGTVSVNYSIYWDDPGPFGTQLNSDHAFLNLAMVLCYVADRRTEDTRVVFDHLPEGWRAAAELDTSGTAAGQRSGAYVAPSYDALVDAPVEIGRFDEFRFEAGGRPIRVAIHGDAGDRGRLQESLQRVVDYEVSLMDGAPFREYLFLFHVGSNFGGGGMEHMNSTAISVDTPSQLPSYAAHELFHAWNVKRIRPQSLEPVNYNHEMWTRSLWFAEGVTNTYGAYTLLRSGLWSSAQFYGNLADQITELQSRPARRWQSVEQSSLDAWFEKYPLYNRPEESISYYNKGQILGVLLDLEIRDRTDNRASLDDVLRALNDKYAKTGRFYDESKALQAAMEEVIRWKAPSANADLADFFRRYISGTEEIPYADFLARAGWAIRDASQQHAAFGFAVGRGPGGPASISSVEKESSAAEAGLQEGDILVMLNGAPFPRSPARWLHDHQLGERVTVKVSRSGVEKEFTFTLGRQSEAVYQISEIPGPTDKQRRIREGILHGTTTP
jgi:predicted metalloprotease with PDZ domain